MEQTSYIHNVLRNWSKKANWPYFSSILIKNENIPLLEEEIGKHDYIWLLDTTKNRICKEISPCVIRYENERNLSFSSEYILEDWEIVSLIMIGDRNWKGLKRINQSRARYFYKFGEYQQARKWLLKSSFTLKNIGYYITSYFPSIAKFIVKKYNVWN